MAWFERGASKIYYEEDGKGDPVLLLPGFSGSIDGFVVLRHALAATGYRVIAADLPGSGRSQPQPRDYPASYYEEDAGAFTALLQHLRATPTHLMGFSDGGEVALLMAVLKPEIARSIVTWGASGVLNDPDGQLRGAFSNLIDHPIPPLQDYRDFLITTYGEGNARSMIRNLIRAQNQIVEAGGDISRSKASSITCPVLLIAGEHDFFSPAALLAQTAALIPTAEVLEVEGAGHDAHNARPESFAQTIVDWLKKHSFDPINTVK